MKFVGNFTESMKDYTERKLQKLGNRNIDYENARITYNHIAKGCVVEISIDNKLRAKKSGEPEDYYDLVLEIVECLMSQADRYNKYNSRKKRDNQVLESFAEEFEFEDENLPKYEISRNKTLNIEGMTVNDAIEEMEVLGHTFFIFKDLENNDSTSVVYKRYDGTYGTIQVLD